MSLSAAEEAKINSAAGTGILPIGSAGAPFAQTFDRRMAISTVFAITSGTMTMTGIILAQGQVVNGITFVSGSTAESGGSHLWYALYDANLVLLGQATDNTGAAAFGANTAFRMAMTTAIRVPASGLYYIGICVVGTPMTLINVTAATANGNGSIAGMTPIVAATSSAGLNTGTAPNPAGALTGIAQALYAAVD